MRARVAADLGDPLACGHGVDAASAFEDLLLDRRAVGGHEQLLLPLRPQERRAHLHVLVLYRALGPQAVLDLVGERDLERVLVDRSPVLALGRLERSERALVAARRGFRESGRTFRGGAGALGAQVVVAGEPPGAADEHAHADPLGLGVIEAVDALVPRGHVLLPAHDRARVCIGRTGGESRGHRLVAELPHEGEA